MRTQDSKDALIEFLRAEVNKLTQETTTLREWNFVLNKKIIDRNIEINSLKKNQDPNVFKEIHRKGQNNE